MVLSKRSFSQAVLKKEFVENRSRDHVFYFFTDAEGRICEGIRTKISHGGGTCLSESLIVQMSHQMMFAKKADLESFVGCRISEEEYWEILRG